MTLIITGSHATAESKYNHAYCSESFMIDSTQNTSTWSLSVLFHVQFSVISARHENLTLDNLACYLSNPFICTTTDCFQLKGLDLWSLREANTREQKLGTFSVLIAMRPPFSHKSKSTLFRKTFLLEISQYSVWSVFHLTKSTENVRSWVAMNRIIFFSICAFPCSYDYVSATLLLAQCIQWEISVCLFSCEIKPSPVISI